MNPPDTSTLATILLTNNFRAKFDILFKELPQRSGHNTVRYIFTTLNDIETIKYFNLPRKEEGIAKAIRKVVARVVSGRY